MIRMTPAVMYMVFSGSVPVQGVLGSGDGRGGLCGTA